MTPERVARLRRVGLWLGGALAIAAVVHTAWRANQGSITVAHAAGLAGIVVSVVVVLGALAIAAREPGAGGWVLFWLALGAFGGGVVAPLWRLSTPAALQVRETLTGDRRDVTLPEAPRDGTYRLEVAGAPSRNPAAGGSYVLLARVGETTERIEGRRAAEPSVFEVGLTEGQSLRLFLERSDGAITVTLGEPAVSRQWWFVVLAVLAALLAALADALSTTRKLRGLFTIAVASASVYAIAMTGASNPTPPTVLGTAVVALFAGGTYAVLIQFLLGMTVARRRG